VICKEQFPVYLLCDFNDLYLQGIVPGQACILRAGNFPEVSKSVFDENVVSSCDSQSEKSFPPSFEIKKHPRKLLIDG